MRAWLPLLSLVACEPSLRPPPQQPAGTNTLNGCRSWSTDVLVDYTCATHEIVDSAVQGASLPVIARSLSAKARKKGLESTMRMIDLKGADNAIVIEYSEASGSRAFDVLAMQPLDTQDRMLQCHEPLFDNASSLPGREDSCARTLEVLLQRPAPAVHDITPACDRATDYVRTLRSRIDPLANADDIHDDVRLFVARCTDKVAECAMAARSYVEAKACED